MKKRTFTLLALFTCFFAGCVLLGYFISRRRKREDITDYELSAPADEPDYLDDLDAPELPEKEEKIPSKVRRGYIPIQLGRDA